MDDILFSKNGTIFILSIMMRVIIRLRQIRIKQGQIQLARVQFTFKESTLNLVGSCLVKVILIVKNLVTHGENSQNKTNYTINLYPIGRDNRMVSK